MKYLMTLALSALFFVPAFAEPTVEDVSATPVEWEQLNKDRGDFHDVVFMDKVLKETNFIVGKNSHCSGTLISLKEKLILTNHHCIGKYVRYRKKKVVKDGVVAEVEVEDLSRVTVFQNKYGGERGYEKVGEQSFQAEIVARWQASDLALLQLLADDVPHTISSPVFSGEKVYRGEEAYIVGNPLGLLDTSVTKGIISSTNRSFKVRWADNQFVPFLQVDSGITGGNSGGALYNQWGELIGVPTARARDGHLGLAIPFFRVQELLTENCYEQVWNSQQTETYDECVERKEKEAEKEAAKKFGLSGHTSADSAEDYGPTCATASIREGDLLIIRGDAPNDICDSSESSEL